VPKKFTPLETIESQQKALMFLTGFIWVILAVFFIAFAVKEDAFALDPSLDPSFKYIRRVYPAGLKGVGRSTPLRLDKKASLSLSHYIMALFYYDLGELEKAVKEYEDALRLDNGVALVHLDFAVTLIKKNEISRAMDELNYTIKLDPEAIEPHAVLALLNLAQGKPGLAVKEYEAALKNSSKFNPNDPEVHFYLGALYSEGELKNNVLLEEEFKKAIALKPDYAEALNFLGYTYVENNKNLKVAEDLIKRALKVDPDNGAYIDSLGWLYYKRGRFKEAKETLEKAVSLMPDPVIFDHLGDVFFKIKDIKNAQANWQESLKLNPTQDDLKKKIEALKDK